MKKGQRRTPNQLERDRREIARLYLRGELQFAIGERLGLSQQTVSNDLKVIREQWKVDRVNDINERKNIELARIDELEREYWSAWDESKKPAENKEIKSKGVVVKYENKKRKEITPVETKRSISERTGNAAYLRGVEWCISKRCEILGLNAPRNVDVTSGGEKISINFNWIDATDND